jgi:hypothetical protein
LARQVNFMGTTHWVSQLVSGGGADKAARLAMNRFGTRMCVSPLHTETPRLMV